MPNYLVIDITNRTSVVAQSCEDAARVARISPEEIEHALEELGVCETDHYTIVEVLAWQNRVRFRT